MRGKMLFLGGLAAGFVFGARSGRETYDGMVRTARKVKESPTVQEAAGVIQEQASRLYSDGKRWLAETRLGETELYRRFFGPDGARAHEETPSTSTTGIVAPTTAGTAAPVAPDLAEPVLPESDVSGLPTEGLASSKKGASSKSS